MLKFLKDGTRVYERGRDMENLQQYVHSGWEEIASSGKDKHYFVRNDAAGAERAISEIQYQLSVEVPDELKTFFAEVGFGFLWFCLKARKGLYRVLSPEEILNLYFEPEEDGAPDDLITYRENAWSRLEENQLLAFCLFGEEDSLLYIGVSDGGVYYLSSNRKIAGSLHEFLELLDAEVDYFMP